MNVKDSNDENNVLCVGGPPVVMPLWILNLTRTRHEVRIRTKLRFARLRTLYRMVYYRIGGD